MRAADWKSVIKVFNKISYKEKKLISKLLIFALPFIIINVGYSFKMIILQYKHERNMSKIQKMSCTDVGNNCAQNK